MWRVSGESLVISLLILLNFSTGEEDFYGLLDVDKSADVKTIRKAFKKLALVKHPDKNHVSWFWVFFWGCD